MYKTSCTKTYLSFLTKIDKENILIMYKKNRKIKNRSLLLAVSFLFCLNISGIQAQDEWSLEDCIQYAVDNNIQIKRQELAVKMAKNDYRGSLGQVLPRITASGGHSIFNGRAVNFDNYTYVNTTQQYGNVNLNGGINVFNGLMNHNSIQQNKFNLKARLEDLEGTKNNIAINIATAYLQILFNEELLEVAQGQLNVTLQQVERAQLLVDVGNAPVGSLYEIKSQAAGEQLTVITYNNALNSALLTLTQLLHLDSIGDFKIQHPVLSDIDEASILQPVEYIYSEALSILPQIRSAEYNVKSSERTLAVARGQRLPSIFVGAGINSRYSDLAKNPLDPESEYTYMEQIEDNRNTGIQFNLDIPIFNRFVTQTNIGNSKIGMLDAKLALDQARQALYQEIQLKHADAVAAMERYRSAKEAVISMEEAFNYAQKQFEVGVMNTVDYNLAKNNLARAQSDLLQAKYEYIFQTKLLDFYSGKQITL